jgi:hypothetical protein
MGTREKYLGTDRAKDDAAREESRRAQRAEPAAAAA